MNKTTQDMNDSVKFKGYWLKVKEGDCRQRLGGRVARCLLVAALLFGGMTARAQQNYVFMYNGYFVGNGSTPTTTFVPNASIYSGTSGTRNIQNADGYYIAYSSGSSATQGSYNITIGSNGYVYLTDYTNYYLNMNNPNNNNRAWRISNTTNYRATAYSVSTEVVKSLSDFTITGDDVLTSATSYSYTHSNTSFSNYTKYSWTNNTYYSTNASQAASTSVPAATAVTTGYTWSLEGGGTNASLNASTGQITVNSLPVSDLTMTLKCSVTSNGITKTATKVITIQGTKPSAPNISISGTTATLSTTAAGSTTIRYTLDGTEPTASVGTVYSGAIDLSASGTSPVTIKAVTVRGGTASDVSTETVTLTVDAPVITVDGAAGTATITAAAGTTIYYTTNGSTPTTSSTQYTGALSGLPPMTTVKAIAVKSGWNNSPVASETVQIPSGTSGGKVTLFDYEDHNWTYYAGVDANIDGGNYNTNYVNRLYCPDPRNVKITYKANGGAVSIDESETEFVYYKTIEKINGSYTYTVISNPFSKRPNGKGFGGWRIKEGADYISGYSDEAILPLDASITFTNLPYPSVNCTSAEIELEATWVNLNDITYANGNTITYSVSGGNYETNILVLNRNVTGTITTTSPVTIMMVEPDGSADYRNTYTFTGNITPNNTGVTKIEFTRWNSTNTLNCNNHSVTVGRGMTTASQCASYVTGVTGSTSNNGRTTYSNNLNYHLKLESGVFTDVSFIAGTEGTAGYVSCNGTSNQVKGTLGNDYDRANGDNTKLTVSDELFLGYRPTYASGNQNNANFTCWVKSGNLCSGTNVTNTTFNGSGAPNGGYYGDASQLFYVSVGGTQTNIGKRTVYIEGGILSGIAGGIDANNGANNESFFVRMTGGQVRGVMYGSGAFAASSGIRRFVITGGTINGWVAAGCNGTDPTQSGGTLPSDTYVYVGGTSHIGNATDLTLNTSSDGNIFGAGSGNSAQATTGQVNNSNVVIADECYVKKNVYGGGNYGYSNATATVYVTGGEVANSVFGGSNQKQGVTVNVNMTGGQVDNGVYGGSNTSGTISGNVSMKINGGTVGNGDDGDGVFGGGYGSSTIVTGNVTVALGASTSAPDSATVNGNVYGGSALGQTNTGNTTNTTTVTMNKALVNGNVFGGALGNGAVVNGKITVTVNGGRVNGNIFGGGDAASYSPSSNHPIVNMTGGQATHVFGGGKGSTAAVTGNPQVTLSGTAHVTGNVYGGGDAAAVSGQTNVILRD